MKKEYILTSVIVILLIGLGISIYFLTSVRNVQSPVGPEHRSIDTVYMTKFVKLPEYKYNYNPTRFIIFTDIDTVRISTIEVIHDTVSITTVDSTRINYSSQFLTQYPTNPKLLQVLLSSNNLELSLLDTDGQISTQQYALDLDKFKYNYQPFGMTYQKNSFLKRLKPFAEIQFRPINLLLDVNLGIYYKTSKINYEIGLNGFYYPHLKTYPGGDIYFKLRYEF